jgi:hypothetical protein
VRQERAFKRLLGVSLEPRARRVGDITILPLARFLEQLWGGGSRDGRRLSGRHRLADPTWRWR